MIISDACNQLVWCRTEAASVPSPNAMIAGWYIDMYPTTVADSFGCASALPTPPPPNTRNPPFPQAHADYVNFMAAQGQAAQQAQDMAGGASTLQGKREVGIRKCFASAAPTIFLGRAPGREDVCSFIQSLLHL